MMQNIKVGMGKITRRFLPSEAAKPCVIAGLIFDDAPGFDSHSDGDVVFHAICQAISSVTGVPILGAIANDLCLKGGITDSEVYLKEALKTLRSQKISHVAISLEGKRPKLSERYLEMCENISRVMNLEASQIGITAISGDGLNDCGCGDGLQCLALVTLYQP